MPERSKILKNYRVTMERDSEGMIWLRVFLASMPAGHHGHHGHIHGDVRMNDQDHFTNDGSTGGVLSKKFANAANFDVSQMLRIARDLVEAGCAEAVAE